MTQIGPGFLDLPPRSVKPRGQGLTHVLDKGLSYVALQSLVQTAGDCIDIVKLGWGTSYVSDGVRAKVLLCRDSGIHLSPGGTLLEIQQKSGPADIAQLRATLGGLGLGDVQLQLFGGPSDVLIRIAQQPGGDAEQQAAIQKVRQALGDAVDYRRVEVVGPRVSSELLAYGVGGLMLEISCSSFWRVAVANSSGLVIGIMNEPGPPITQLA